MKISLQGVVMIHISFAHNQRQNTIDPQSSTGNWDKKCHVTSDHQIIRLSNVM